VATKPRKWPTYALEVLEQCRLLSRQIKNSTREAQIANSRGERQMVSVHLADIRETNARIDELLAGARMGDYEGLFHELQTPL
jgi:hypothetical protein